MPNVYGEVYGEAEGGAGAALSTAHRFGPPSLAADDESAANLPAGEFDVTGGFDEVVIGTSSYVRDTPK